MKPRLPRRSIHVFICGVLLSILSDITSAEIILPAPFNERKSNPETGFYLGPYLEGNGITNITVQVDTNAYLPCKVKQLGNKSVSWVRVRDDHILSVDRMTFIADERFQAHIKDPPKEWTLQIKFVQPRDAGVYECQVSTEPKVSARVHLRVIVPKTELSGDADRYVKTGSTVVLRCIIHGALESPSYIIWYHGAQQILPDNQQGVHMHIEKGQNNLDPESVHNTINVGSLIIDAAKKRDSGNYTCNPSNSPQATVALHVISGESSASAVTSSAHCPGTFGSIFFSIVTLSIAMPFICHYRT